MPAPTRRFLVFGPALAAFPLLVAGPALADDNAAFVSQSVPEFMVAGTSVPVSLTFRNTGTTSWAPSGGYTLASPDAANSSTWEVSSVALPSTVVESGSSVTFSFRVHAPPVLGTFDFQWQMERGTTFFGARSTNVPVRIKG